MGVIQDHRGRWQPWLGTVKILWGRLTNDLWLELRGRQLRHTSLLRGSGFFAQGRPAIRLTEARARAGRWAP